MRAALIGKPLGHSYSKIIHERLGYGYDLVELDECEILPLLKDQKYNGFNVTIPYKKTVMPLLDFISDEAREIGSVNTVVVRNSRLFGYNTDYYGLEYLVNDAGIDMVGKSVLILGTGGTSATSQVLCRKLGASKIMVVGRSSTINYSNCYKCTDVQIVINTTPVGMYPNVDERPVDLSLFPLLEGVIDVVYNPLNTDLLLQAKALDVKCAGGLKMLVAQAVFASELFTDSKYEAGLIDKLFKEIQTHATAIVLIGMPSCGKSTLGMALAEKLGKEFIDTDKLVEEIAGKSIPQIFSEDGEGAFRDYEERAIDIASLKRNAVVATGGGAVLREKNRVKLKRNSVVIHVKRNVESLSLLGRPLSKSTDALKSMEIERMPIYCDLADFSVQNNGTIEQALLEVLKEIK